VAPEAVGLGVTALIGIVEDSVAETDDVLAALRQMPEIESCYFLAGVESFLLKARVGTIAELEQLIMRLNRTSGVASTRTAIALSTKWENRPQPVTPS
jgi:Lrp/AsnC family transcriptional regulator, leucine-responsive regulatory protein